MVLFFGPVLNPVVPLSCNVEVGLETSSDIDIVNSGFSSTTIEVRLWDVSLTIGVAFNDAETPVLVYLFLHPRHLVSVSRRRLVQ